MNEEYFNQIDELLSQGMTEMEVYESITSSEGFTGSRNQLITDIISKKKGSEAPQPAEDLSGQGVQNTAPDQPFTSDLEEPDLGSSLQEGQVDLVNKAQTEIGDAYSSWLGNALKQGEPEEGFQYASDYEESGLPIVGVESTGDRLAQASLLPITGIYGYLLSPSKIYSSLFDDDDQQVRNDMPIPPKGTPAYKQYYESLPSYLQNDLPAPPDYLEYEFTEKQEQLAEDLYKNISDRFREQEGLIQNIRNHNKPAQDALADQLDAGEISESEYQFALEEIRQQGVQSSFQTFMEDKGAAIVRNAFPEEMKADEDFLENFSDKMYFEYGLDTDLDNDGQYNSQGIVGSLAASADAELFRMINGIGGFLISAGDSVAEKLGGDLETDEEAKARRDLFNRRLEAEYADATILTKSMTESFSDGDIVAGFTHIGNGVGAMLPLIAMTAVEGLATGGGSIASGASFAKFGALAARGGMTAARFSRASKIGKAAYKGLIKGSGSQLLYGLGTGSATYMEIADQEGWGEGALGTADKIGYSVLTGLGDYALGRIGRHGFRTNAAMQTAEKSFRAGKIISKESGKLLNQQMLKGYATARGLSIGGEALSEATTNALQYMVEANSKGEEVSMSKMFDQALEGAIMGATIGGFFDLAGGSVGKVKAAVVGGKYDVDLHSDLQVLAADRSRLVELHDNTSSEKKKAILVADIERIDKRVRDINNSQAPLYEMMSVRHPKDLESVNKLDIAIYKKTIEMRNATAEQQGQVRGELKALVDQRNQITTKYKAELQETPLNTEEKQSLAESKIDEKIQFIAKELEVQTLAAKERADAGPDGVSETTREQGERILKKTENDLAEAQRLKQEYFDAKKRYEEKENESATGLFDEAALTVAREDVIDAQQNLFEYLGLNPENEGVKDIAEPPAQTEADRFEVPEDQIPEPTQEGGSVTVKEIKDVNVEGEVPTGAVVFEQRDADGNVVETVEAETNLSERVQPEAAVETDAEPEVDVFSEETDTPEVKSTEVNAMKDGSYRVSDDVPHLNQKDRRFLNRYLPRIKKMYPNLRVVIAHDFDSAVAIGKQAGVSFAETGGAFDRGTSTIYINPEVVSLNAELEAQGGLIRKKTLSETILEESFHALIGPAVENMTPAQRKKIRSEIDRIVKSDKGLAERLAAKESTYKQTESDAVVDEEVLVEFLSAVAAGDLSVKTGLASKVRVIINKILSAAGMKDLTIKSDSSVLDMVAAIKRFQDGADLRVETQQKAKDQTKKSQRLSAFALSEDGPIEVKFQRTNYKYYRDGSRKDIGSYEDSMTFNGKWHFINWWKKATDFGKNEEVFDFEVGGRSIDVNQLVNAKFKDKPRYSTRLSRYGGEGSEVTNRFTRRNADAVSQGVINPAIAGAMANKMRAIKNKIRTYEGMSDSDKQFMGKDYYDRLVQRARDIEDKQVAFIAKEANRQNINFYFSEDDPSVKSSLLLRKEFIDRPISQLEVNYSRFSKLKNEYLCNKVGLKKLCSTATDTTLRQYFSHALRERYGITPELIKSNPKEAKARMVEILGREVVLLQDANVIKEELNDVDPMTFFKDHKEAKSRYFDSLSRRDGIDPEVTKELEPILDFVIAITSNGSRATPNLGVSMDLFRIIAKEYQSGNTDVASTGVIPKKVIDLIQKQSDYDLEYGYVRGDRMVRISSQLEILNELSKGFANADGKFRPQAFIKKMGEPVGRKFDVFAQTQFGQKLGAYGLNLAGDLSVPTQDSHVFSYFGVLSQRMPDYRQFGKGNIDKLRADLEGLGVDTNKMGPKKLFAALRKLRSDESKSLEVRKKASRIYGKLITPKTHEDTVRIRSFNAEVMQTVAKNLGISPAEVGQAIYATSQATFGFEYTPNARIMDQLIAEGADGKPVYENMSENAMQESVKAEIAEPTPEPFQSTYGGIMESKRLSKVQEHQLSMFDTIPMDDVPAKQMAEDSDLFRNRPREEALNYRGKMLTNEAERQALNTDKNSVRIINENNEVNVGDIVGVRLNLNVLKNTGVPVQTLHQKSASGKALKYATAVTIKNPTLFVNQGAREKIATFQENKFPMASVNGEFVSASIDDTNFDGVKAVFNPFKTNVFMDVAGRPIKSASEATIIGNDVFLRGEIEYYDFADPIVTAGRAESEKGRAKRTARGEKYNKAVNRFKGFSERVLGVTYETRAELETAYDNLPVQSQVALDNSEYAKNLQDNEVRMKASRRLRKTAGRAARTYEGGVRKAILDNPENYISKQNLKDARAKLESMSVQELVDIMTNDALGRLQNRNDDLGVLAVNELISRAVADGDLDRIPGLIEEAAKVGTTAGRLLRHFREIKSSTPQGMYQIFMKEVERRGNTLSDDQKKRLTQMTTTLFDLHQKHEDLMKRAISGEDVETELKSITDQALKAERELNTFANAVIEKGWGDLLTQLIQGNLLTPMSQITNVGANMINALGKGVVDAIALPVERLINLFGIDSPIKRNYSLNAYIYGIRKFGSGFVEALDEIYTGQTKDVTEWRVERGFAPFRSLKAAMGKGDLPMGLDGRSNLSQRIKLFVQGTLGIPAETMFRFLSLGDTPFRRGVEGIELYQAALAQGLEGQALKNFIKYPDKRARELAEREGRKLTYQERTTGSEIAEQSINFLQRMLAKGFGVLPGVNGEAVGKFLVRSSVPYVRTPANILMDTLTFVSPYVAGVRIMSDLKKKDARSAAQNFGKIVVGSMVTQTAMVLIKEGLISGAVEWNEDEEKNLAYDQFPPNSINISGLRRWINGESTEKRPDDQFISYNKLGIPGTIMGAMIKGADRDEIRSREYEDFGFLHHAVTDSFGLGPFSSISHMMDQSFLQGVNNFMEILTSTDPDDFSTASERWLASTFKSVSAIALPNTLSALHRAEREFLPDTRITKDMSYGERLYKRLEYIVKDRTFGATDIPVRVNWKGQPIEQNPRGNMGWTYQLFDITKLRKGEDDHVSQEMFRLFEQLEAVPDVVGTPGYAQKRKINVPNMTTRKAKMALKRAGLDDLSFLKDGAFLDEKVYLNTEQLNRLMAVSGKARYAEIEELITSEKYFRLSDQEKLEALNELNQNYNSQIEIERGRLKPHSIELVRIMQEIYDGREE